MRFSLKAARAKLGKLVEGSLEGIKILQRGISPRIVKAQVVGTKGSVMVTGAQLRKVLGTPSTWVKFTTVSAHGVQTSTTPAVTTTVPAITTPTITDTGTTTTGTTTTGGGGLGTAAAVSPLGPIVSLVDQIADLLGLGTFNAIHYEVNGTIFPVARGTRVTVQSNHRGSWVTAGTGLVGAGGRYSVSVAHPGEYRVLYDGTVGPEITV
jgi:stage II sporulation protein D